MPSLRRPVIETMKAEASRIRKRQERALKRVKDAELKLEADDPRIDALEASAALTEQEVATLEAAAKVAALLERVPEKEDDEEEKPLTDEERAAVVARVSRSGPTPLTSNAGPTEE
jgi:hypothetical protein